MKKKKILIITLTTLFLTIGGFALYMALNYLLHDDYKNWIEPPAVAQEGTEFTALSDSARDIPDMILAAENDQFKLYTNTTTSHVAIYDKESGMTAYSNPVDLEQDELAKGSNRSELQSQIVIDYFDSNRNRVRVNNYDMSIASEQFTLEHIEDGIRYTYVLADNTSETGIVPLTISETELEELGINGISFCAISCAVKVCNHTLPGPVKVVKNKPCPPKKIFLNPFTDSTSY